jgi:hypothetical protein
LLLALWVHAVTLDPVLETGSFNDPAKLQARVFILVGTPLTGSLSLEKPRQGVDDS